MSDESEILAVEGTVRAQAEQLLKRWITQIDDNYHDLNDTVSEIVAFGLEQRRLGRADLEEAIRQHRDARGDDRCWMDDEELYKALPEGYSPPERDTAVELERCKQFIASRQNPATMYVSPQRRIEELEERLGRADQQAEWRPIETAPKDGTPFIAANPMDAFRAFYDTEQSVWICEDDGKWFGQLRYPPTHWMPLPSPPLPSGSRQQQEHEEDDAGLLGSTVPGDSQR